MDEIEGVLNDFIATIEAKPNLSNGELLKKFPEFKNNKELLNAAFDYSATISSGKYKGKEELHSKFPEFFKTEGVNKKDSFPSPSGNSKIENPFQEVKKKDSSLVSESPKTDGSLESNTTLSDKDSENKIQVPDFSKMESDRFSSIGKGLKEAIIPRTEQQEIDLINKLTNETSISKEEEEEEIKQIEADDNNEGVWNTVKKGTKDWWNRKTKEWSENTGIKQSDIVPVETDNLKESREKAEKKLKKEKKEITPEVLKQETYNIELKKRKKQLKKKKTEDFIENLQDDKNISDLGFFKEKFKMDFSKKNASSIKLSLEIEKDKKQSDILVSELNALNQKAIYGTATEEDRDLFNKKRDELQSIEINIDNSIKEFNKLDDEILNTKEEIDLFNRNYDNFDNFTGRFTLASADLGTNILYLLNEANQLNTVNPLIPLSASLSLEKKLTGFKKSISEGREKLKQDVKASEIRNVYDLFEWGANITSTQAPQLIMMGATGSLGLGATAFASGGEKAFQIDEDDKKSGKITDPLKRVSSIALSTGVTFLSEKISLGQLNKMKRVFKSVPVKELKQTSSQYVKNNYKEYFKDLTEETLSEVSEAIGNNLIDGLILGKDVKWHKGIDGEMLLSTVFMANMFKAPALAKDIHKAILRKDYNQAIGENNSKILKYNELIINSDLSDSDKSDLKERSEKLLDQNNAILEKAMKKAASLSAEKKNRIFEIENEIYNYRKKYQKVKNSSHDQQTKNDLLRDLEKDVEVLEGEREGILKEQPITKKETEAKKEETSKEFKKIDKIIDSNQDTDFNPLESEGESVSRLANSVSENKSIEQVAKEHKDSYLEYLKDEEVGSDVLESEFVKTFEDKLISALKNPTKFNPKQERSFENGSRLNKEGKLISEETYLSEKGNLDVKQPKETIIKENGAKESKTEKQENVVIEPKITETTTENQTKGIDNVIESKDKTGSSNVSIKTETKKTIEKTPIKVETNRDIYTVSNKDGELQIEAKLAGKKAVISKTEKKKITDNYKDSFDFSKGERTNFEGAENINETQVAEKISEESNNPLEIIETLQSVRESNKDIKENTELSKEEAIANTLSSYALVDSAKKEVDDLGKSYTNSGLKRNKEKKNTDQIAELASSQLGIEVTQGDVLEFLGSYEKISDYRKSRPTENLLENNLKDRFKKITGLKLDSNLENKISEKYNSKKEESSETDIPFQTESSQTNIKGNELNYLVDRLKKTGLAKAVEILSNKDVKSFLKKINRKDYIETPFGFVHNDIVYLNKDSVKTDTPIHEFGHLWNAYIKKNNKEVYDRGLELMYEKSQEKLILKDGVYYTEKGYKATRKDLEKIGNEYVLSVLNNSSYDKLSVEQVLEESLAQAIGEKGVKILKESKKEQFNSWFNNLFKKIARGLGLKNMSGDKLSKLTLDKFTDLAGAELLSGIEIVKKPKEKTIKGKQANVSNIDVVVKTEQTKTLERQRLQELIDSKKEISKSVKKEVQKYLLESIEANYLPFLKKNELSSLTTLVKNSETLNDLKKAMPKIDALQEKLAKRKEEFKQTKTLERQKLLDRFRKAKSVSESLRKDVEKYINSQLSIRRLNDANKNDIRRLTSLINKTKSVKSLKKHLMEADGIFKGIDNRRTYNTILKLLNKGLSKKTNNFEKGNHLDKNVNSVFTAINEIIKKRPKSVKTNVPFSKKPRKEILLDYINSLEERIQEINTKKVTENGVDSFIVKESLTEKEINETVALTIAKDILDSELINDPFVKEQVLLRTKEQVESLYFLGKNIMDSKREANKVAYENKKESINNDTDPLNRRNKRENKYRKSDDIIKEKNKSKTLVGFAKKTFLKIIQNGVYNYMINDIQALASKLSKTGEDVNFSAIYRHIRDVNLADDKKTTILREAKDKIKNAKESIFKGKHKTLTEFRKEVTFTKEFVDEDGNIETDTVTLSQDVVLDIYLTSLRPDTKASLEKSGISEKAIKEITEQLSPKMKEYGDFLIEYYTELHPRISKIYEDLNLIPLGFINNYTGKMHKEGVNESDIDLNSITGFLGTTTFGSLKTTTKNSLPISFMSADMKINEYIDGYAHYVAYAKIERDNSKLLRDEDFKKAITLNNGTQGGYILGLLNDHNNRYVKKNGSINEDVKALSWLHRAIVSYILGGKVKNAVTQSVSAVNGLVEMPSLTLSETKEVTVNLFADFKFLINNSNFLKNRRDKEQLKKALSNIEASYNSGAKNISADNDIAAHINLFLQTLNSNIQKGLFTPISIGDFMGVMGTLPVYRAYLIKVKKDNPKWSDKQIQEEALTIFESTANNSQQSQTKGGKSKLQNTSNAKIVLSFSTSVLSNIKNASKARNEMSRHIKHTLAKNKTTSQLLDLIGVDTELAKKVKGKGSFKKQLLRFANFGFAQNTLYAMASSGSLYTSFKGIELLYRLVFDEEENEKILDQYTDNEKNITASLIGGQIQETPVLSYFIKKEIDLVLLEKDRTWASVMPHLIADELDDIEKYDKNAIKAKRKADKIINKKSVAYEEAIKKYNYWQNQKYIKLTAIATKFPSAWVKILNKMDIIFDKTDFTITEKGKAVFGWNVNSIIEEKKIKKKRRE